MQILPSAVTYEPIAVELKPAASRPSQNGKQPQCQVANDPTRAGSIALVAMPPSISRMGGPCVTARRA